MHKITFTFSVFFFVLGGVKAQTIWDGDPITFTKAANADWTLEENQDRITDNIWITRQNNMGIFNIATEDSYSDFSSPEGTAWAFGTTEDIQSLTFESWEDAVNSSPPSSVGQAMVLHLIEADVYIDITFDAWGQGSNGGGSFTYTRTTDPALSIDNASLDGLSFYPNPAKDLIHFNGLNEIKTVEVLDISGKLVLKEQVSSNKALQVEALHSGFYFLKIEGKQPAKFIKQ